MLTQAGPAAGVRRGGHDLIGAIRGSGGAWGGDQGQNYRSWGPLSPPDPPRPLPLTCWAGGGAAHGTARQRARARGGGVSSEWGVVSSQRGGASPRGPAPSAGLVDHGVGDIHGGGCGGLGWHRNAPEGRDGEGGDTCPGHLSPLPGSPVPAASTHLSSAGRRARRATASWYRGGWGGKGGSPAAPQTGAAGTPASLQPPLRAPRALGVPCDRPGPFFHFPFPGAGSAAAALVPPPRPGCSRPPGPPPRPGSPLSLT